MARFSFPSEQFQLSHCPALCLLIIWLSRLLQYFFIHHQEDQIVATQTRQNERLRRENKRLKEEISTIATASDNKKCASSVFWLVFSGAPLVAVSDLDSMYFLRLHLLLRLPP